MSKTRSTNRPMWIPASEACSILGVKRQTLYTYVSRGMLESRPGQGRSRLYLRADVERLRARAQDHGGHRTRASAALSWGGPVLSTEIGGIDADGPWYRGRAAMDLMQTPFSEVCELLWRLPEADWGRVSGSGHARDLLELRGEVDRLASEALLGLLEQEPEAQPVFELIERLSPSKPNIDAALVALCRVLGRPPEFAALLFAVARSAGWIAHALEQGERGLLRPTSSYAAWTG